MNITFLGTGTSQGVPVIACSCDTCNSKDSYDKRLRSSILFEVDETKIVIDAGPDFRQQMLTNNINNLDAILLTHEHRDHIAGLDDVRAYNYVQKKEMPIYAEKRVLESVENEFGYAFAKKKYPGVPEFDLKEIREDIAFEVKNIKIIPIRGMHLHLPVLAFRINNVAYITDVNHIPENEYLKLQNLDVLIINALRKEKHISHFSLEEALQEIKKIKPKKAYLTHISHLMGKHKEISKELPANVQLAYDGLSIANISS